MTTLRNTLLVLVTALSTVSAAAAELRAGFSSECPMGSPLQEGAPESAELIATGIAVALIEPLISEGFKAAKKAVTPESVHVENRFAQLGFFNLEKPSDGAAVLRHNAALNCLVVAVLPPASQWGSTADFTTDAATKARLKEALGTSVLPYIYLEATRLDADDKSVVTWSAKKLFVNRFISSDFFAGKTRSMKVEVRMYEAGATAPFISLDYDFPAVTEAFVFQEDPSSFVHLGQWVKTPALPKIPEKVERSMLLMPLTLEARVIEHPKPYKLAEMLVTAAESQKGEIVSELKQAVDKTARDAAKTERQNRSLAAITAYLGGHKTAGEACTPAKVQGSPTGRTECSIAVDRASQLRELATTACALERVTSCETIPTLPTVPN